MVENKEEGGSKVAYTCHCGCKFERHVSKGCQVKCPECLNFIPTFKRERTNNFVGKKHIHMVKNKMIYGEK